METSNKIINNISNYNSAIIKEEVKKNILHTTNLNEKEADKTFYLTSGTEQKASIQHSSDIAKDIICSIIKNSDKEMNFTKEEAMAISIMYDIIYRRVEWLKRATNTYGTYKRPTN